MTDEKKVNEVTGEEAEVPKTRHWPIVVSVLAVIIIAILVAFLHWHEQPSFCAAFCHQPMDKYVEGYYSEDTSLSVAKHEQAGVTCLGCHWPQAKMLDLVHEVVMWAGDEFTDPLPNHAFAVGDQAALVSDEFCGRCHNGTDAPTKDQAVNGRYGEYDPHNIPTDVDMHMTAGHDGGAIVCGDCHTVHKVSTLVCARCHADVFNEETAPLGWVVPADGKAATAAMGIYDPHTLVGTEMFENLTPFHATAGADGGPIECADCHDTNTFVCAQCHSEEVGALVPAGWTAPEDSRAQLAEEYGMLDPHALIAMPAFEEVQFHQTGGADGGMITCTDCHDTNTFVCSTCHATDFANLNTQLAEKGWTIPEAFVDEPMMGAPETEEPAEAEEAAETSEAAAPAADATFADGTYQAVGKGIGGDVPVTVTIEGGKIVSVEVGENGETQGIGSKAIEQLPALIVEANGTNGVEGVSGASVTSGAIFSAVNEALAMASA